LFFYSSQKVLSGFI